MLPLRRALASQLGQNILANYLAVAWMGGLTLVLIPFYLRRLGPEQWGVVAICITVQGFLGLLDAGLAQIMPRDIARVAGDRAAEARVFRVFSRAYLALGLAGLLLGQAGVSWLSGDWIARGRGAGADVELALRLVLVQFLFQFSNNAHMGYWNGVQAQALANFRQCAFVTAKHAGALWLVYAWRADALGYLASFVVFSALEWGANARTIRKALGASAGGEISAADFRALGREAGALALGVLIGMLVSQIDRIVLSHSVEMAAYGRYVVVATLGLAFMQLQYPLMRAFFPRIVRAELGGEGGDHHGHTARWLVVGLAALCVLPCFLVAAAAPWVLEAWTGDPRIAAEGSLPLRLILGAVAVNALYQLIYQRMLSQGHWRMVVLVNLAMLAVVTPVAFFAAPVWGIAAGGMAWLAGALVQLGLGLIWRFGVFPRGTVRSLGGGA